MSALQALSQQWQNFELAVGQPGRVIGRARAGAARDAAFAELAQSPGDDRRRRLGAEGSQLIERRAQRDAVGRWDQRDRRIVGGPLAAECVRG